MRIIRRYVEIENMINPQASVLKPQYSERKIVIELCFPEAIEKDLHHPYSVLVKQFGEDLASLGENEMCSFLVIQAQSSLDVEFGFREVSPLHFTEHNDYLPDKNEGLLFNNIALRENEYIRARVLM